MYVAEFAFPGTTELANDLLLQTSSEGTAKNFAQQYASHWGIELFSLTPATDQQVRQYFLLGKTIACESIHQQNAINSPSLISAKISTKQMLPERFS